MNLRDLQYLVALDEECHFHKAAARCYVSQPTLSGQLKKLEQTLGVLLIERTSRQVMMTEAGRAIADQARKVQAEVNIISEIAASFHDPMVGELHVGIIPTIAPYLLPVIMSQISKKYPKLKFWLYEYHTAALLEKMRRAELDVLILALPLPEESNEFSELDLFKEPFQLAVPQKDVLATKNSIALGDLEGREMLLLEEGHCLRGQALEVCSAAGANENARFHASSLETLRYMVGEGMGMTLMPQLAIPKKQKKGDMIQYIAFNDPKPNRRVGLLYRKGSYREETFKKIKEAICSVIPESLLQ